MAQLRAEVRPDVTNMPVDGFLMQTGGSAKRRVVPFDTAMSSYTVTGVPGHTHNSSAVCSVLVDNTEKSNVPFTIGTNFANAEVDHPVDDENGNLVGRYTDSAVVDESDYDRAIERGIGEIAIIPENCHQEIREPVRDIYELRTLVTPKDKLDTLTYVEEVGGFVDQVTGEVPEPEPLYPDVQVDLLFDYDDPIDTGAVVAFNQGVAPGTGNREGSGIATEFRFEGDWSTAPFSRDAAGQGNGTSFAVLVRAGVPFAQAHEVDWDGTVTLQWDPNERHYFCPSFEVIFDRIQEGNNTAVDGAQVVIHENFEVQFPQINTQSSVDGQCVFASGDRPLSDGGTPFPVLCTVNQHNLVKGVKDASIHFWIRPFRIATGYQSAIYGNGSVHSYFTRVRNTEIEPLARHVKQIAPAATMFHNNNVDENQLQAGVRTVYSTAAQVGIPEAELPKIGTRNNDRGTVWYGLPTSITDVPSAFGYTHTFTGMANQVAQFAIAPTAIAVANQGYQFLPVAIRNTVLHGGNQVAPYVAAGPNTGVAGMSTHVVWTTALPAEMQRRVQRTFDFEYMIRHSQIPNVASGPADADDHDWLRGSRIAFNAAVGVHANANVKYVQVVLAIGGAQDVPYQSEDHYAQESLLKTETLDAANTNVATSQQLIGVHGLNLLAIAQGNPPTSADTNNTYPAAYGFQNPIVADAAAQTATVQGHLDHQNGLHAAFLIALAAAQEDERNHLNGNAFVYGVAPAHDKEALFPLLVDPKLNLTYTTDTVAGLALAANESKVVTVPCTLRYMFKDRMLSWRQITDPTDFVPAIIADPNALPPIVGANAVPATPGDPIQDTHWGTYGVGFNIDEEKATEVGHYQQQETAPFSVWTEPNSVELDPNVDLTINVNVDVRSLMEIRRVHQDIPETQAANWHNPAGNGYVAQPLNTRRTVAAAAPDAQSVVVMSVGPADSLQGTKQHGTADNQASSNINKFDTIVKGLGFGSTTSMRVAYDAVNIVPIGGGGALTANPMQNALGNLVPTAVPARSNRSQYALNDQYTVITPSLVAAHNAVANATPLEVAQNVIYISNAHFAYDKNRRFFLVMNDRGTGTAAVKKPTVLVFDSDDCTPILWFDEYFNFASVLTKVRNVRELRLGTTQPARVGELGAAYSLQPADTLTWQMAMANGAGLGGDTAAVDARIGDTPAGAKERNRGWATLYAPSFDYQSTYWNTDPFAQQIADSEVSGVVHRSRLRVSQHLCAPLLNPNRRIGCSAPLNYDSMHLPPELRDFRIELRDRDFSFLPGSTEQTTLESLVLYEFNGGAQDPGTHDSLLYMPHFRSFSTTTTGQAFRLDVFSPYGNPSYIALFARSKVRANELVKQPLIKTLTIQSGTTMKPSNTILEAREHELFHLTQRNVHPRAEYNRNTNKMRQVVLLCAEDIGDMGIVEYQTEKRANFAFSGTLDVPAKVTVLFIYNNRGLRIKNREIGVVRV